MGGVRHEELFHVPFSMSACLPSPTEGKLSPGLILTHSYLLTPPGIHGEKGC